MRNPSKFLGYDTGRLGLWNPANLLTASRLILGVAAVIFFELEVWSPGLAITVMAVASATDLDGFVARRFDCASDFGHYFDPTVDKLFLAIVGTWSIFRVGSLWPLISVLIAGHFVIALYTLQNHRNGNLKATLFGRWTMAATFIAIVSALLAHNVYDSAGLSRVSAVGSTVAVFMIWRNAYNIGRAYKARKAKK